MSGDEVEPSCPSVTDEFPFFSLPLELRLVVYNFLSSKEQKIMRLINRQIKLEVEQNVDFKIRIDPQSYNGCQRVMNLRAHTATILSLTTQKAKALTFKYPERIRRLIFDGALPPSTCHRLMQKCWKLEVLHFTNETLRYSTRFQRCLKLQESLETFKFLTSVNLQFTRKPFADPFQAEDNIMYFLNTTFQHLSSFTLFYSLWGNWLDLFLFLTRHALTLRSLELQVGDRNDNHNTYTYLKRNRHSSVIDVIELDILNSLRLRDFKFRDEVLHLNPTARSLIFGIIAKQTTLEKFHFYSSGDMSPLTFAAVIQANRNTLTEVVVYSMRGKPIVHSDDIFPITLPILDMTLFSTCARLKVLALSCALGSTPLPGRGAGCKVHLRGIGHALTELHLDKLHLTGFVFDEDDLINLSLHTPHVKEVLIADSQMDTVYSTVVKNFIVNSPLLNFVNINPLQREPGLPLSCRAQHDVQELTKLYAHFMQMEYIPTDDLDGFEARDISDTDRAWVKALVKADQVVMRNESP